MTMSIFSAVPALARRNREGRNRKGREGGKQGSSDVGLAPKMEDERFPVGPLKFPAAGSEVYALPFQSDSQRLDLAV